MKHLIWIVPLVVYIITTALFKKWKWVIAPFILGAIILISGWFLNHLTKTTPQPPKVASTQQTVVTTTEALVLEKECWTPCSGFVGWSYKVRTDGDPIRIKYNGCDWFDQPARENLPAPKEFKPGETQFVSSDKKNPHVKVWVYKKITVPAQ